jgi:hypothetical protein
MCWCEPCGNPVGFTCNEKGDTKDWDKYCNCVRNCFYTGDTSTKDTSYNEEAWLKWDEWIDAKVLFKDFLIELDDEISDDNLDNLNGIIDALVPSFNGDIIGGVGAGIKNLIEGVRSKRKQEKLKEKIDNALSGILGKRRWLTDMIVGESNTERFVRYCNRESDCRNLCKDEIPNNY